MHTNKLTHAHTQEEQKKTRSVRWNGAQQQIDTIGWNKVTSKHFVFLRLGCAEPSSMRIRYNNIITKTITIENAIPANLLCSMRCCYCAQSETVAKKLELKRSNMCGVMRCVMLGYFIMLGGNKENSLSFFSICFELNHTFFRFDLLLLFIRWLSLIWFCCCHQFFSIFIEISYFTFPYHAFMMHRLFLYADQLSISVQALQLT